MKKTVSAILIMLILLSAAAVMAAAPETKSGSVILAAQNGSQIIYSKNPDEKLPPAELTKLMTAYTVYKIYGSDVVITVPETISEYTNSMETSMNLKPGEEIKTSSLIYGMLMGQANDAAMAVALYYGGEEDFTKRMNGYAKELGMENTVFKNPTGNYDEGQYTTASDMLKLYKQFCAVGGLYPYISQSSVTLDATNMSPQRTYWTKNHLMSRFIYFDYIYDYATAGISSSSSRGGYSVISSASKGTKDLICIAMDSVFENGVNYSMTDASSLFNYGFDEFTTVTVVKQGDLLYEAKLKNYKGKSTLLLDAEKTLKGYITDADAESSAQGGADCLEKEVVLDEPLKAPIKKGDVVGKIIYKYQGNLFGEVNLIAERDVKRGAMRTIASGIGWFFGLKPVKIILILAACIVGIFYALAANTLSKTRKKRKRQKRRN